MTDQTTTDHESQLGHDNHGGHDSHGGDNGHGGHADHGPSHPVEVDDSDVGAGAATGIWVTGLVCVVLVLLALFAL